MRRILFGLFVAAITLAADKSSTAGSVSGQQAFFLDNVTVPPNGVGSWPLVVGDEIKTVESSVLLSLKDGSEWLIEPNSKVKIVLDGNKLKIVVVSGSAKDWAKEKDRWCWIDSRPKLSHHKCGDGDHDWDDRCCPVKDPK